MKKKILSVILMLLLAFNMVACSCSTNLKDSVEKEETDKDEDNSDNSSDRKTKRNLAVINELRQAMENAMGIEGSQYADVVGSKAEVNNNGEIIIEELFRSSGEKAESYGEAVIEFLGSDRIKLSSDMKNDCIVKIVEFNVDSWKIVLQIESVKADAKYYIDEDGVHEGVHSKYVEEVTLPDETEETTGKPSMEETTTEETIGANHNPYSTDEELLKEYYAYVCNALDEWIYYGDYADCKDKDLATIITMDNYFANNLKEYLTVDYVFTSDEFKGATWKDIVYNGDAHAPSLTLTKNGNTLTYPIIEDEELKKVVDAYIAYGIPGIWLSFAYIDEDNIPELICDYMDTDSDILKYENGKVIEPGENFGGMVGKFVPYGNRIILNGYWHNGESATVTACIKDGTLAILGTYGNAEMLRASYRSIEEAKTDIMYWDSEVEKAVNAYMSYNVQGSRYEFVYIDEDTIPELLCDRQLYTYRNGSVIYSSPDAFFFERADFMYYSARDNIVGTDTRGMEDHVYCSFSINEEGKLVEVSEDEVSKDEYQGCSQGEDNIYTALEKFINEN